MKRLAFALLTGLALAGPAAALLGGVTIVPLDVSTVTTGGAAVTALAAGHRTAGGVISNPVNATVNLCLNEQGTTASGTTTGAQGGALFCLVPGQSYSLQPSSSAVSVISADSAHPFFGYGLQ